MTKYRRSPALTKGTHVAGPRKKTKLKNNYNASRSSEVITYKKGDPKPELPEPPKGRQNKWL